MLENIRFHPGEKENSPELAKQLAQMGDVFVMDAFACAHRAEASVCALANAANEKCIGPLVMKEINAINRILKNAPRPLVGIFGGAKIADKIPIIQNLAQHMDAALIGGGAANALIRAHAGQSIDLPADAEKILNLKNIHLPQDAVAARNPDDESGARNCSPSDLAADEMMLDIGEKTRRHFAKLIHSARAVVWNGPMGVFEKNAFANGTRFVAEAVAESSAFSLAGGGETVAALERFGVAGKISHVSTGGGALLEYLAGRRLPGLAAVGAQ